MNSNSDLIERIKNWLAICEKHAKLQPYEPWHRERADLARDTLAALSPVLPEIEHYKAQIAEYEKLAQAVKTELIHEDGTLVEFYRNNRDLFK